MRTITFFILFTIPLFCIAQNLPREYEYDAAGNRTLRKVVSMQLAPPAPSDSVDYTTVELLDSANLIPQTSNLTPQTADYFVEIIAQVEIKIYPNPTTENVILEIQEWETLQTGTFKLFSLTGQLLQQHVVHSATTTVSLANLPKGTYLLIVKINDRTEEWKVIKN